MIRSSAVPSPISGDYYSLELSIKLAAQLFLPLFPGTITAAEENKNTTTKLFLPLFPGTITAFSFTAVIVDELFLPLFPGTITAK